MKFLQSPTAKRWGSLIALYAVVTVMTGPPGNQSSPTLGFTSSFTETVSFFGLFPAPRGVFFAGLFALVIGFMWLVRWSRGTKIGQLRTAVTVATLDFYREAAERRFARTGFYLVALVIAIALPHVVTDPFWQQAMVSQIAIYVLLAIGLNVVVGFAGLLDLGFVAFYAIGAYTTAWITGALPAAAPFHHHLNPFWAIPIAIVFVMIAGVLLGLPTLRLRGDYLAIVTLGFGEIVTIFLNNLYTITGGSTGSNQIPHFSIHLGALKYAWGLDPVPYYYLTLGFVVVFLFAFSALEHSRVGRSWVAIREDEIAAESVGINPLKYKVIAFAIGAASAGFAGVITGGQSLFINPTTFTLSFSINILVLVIFGGMGSIIGVVIGSLIIQSLSMYLIYAQPVGFQNSDLYIYLGALLIAMMIFRPAGIWPSKRRRREVANVENGLAPDLGNSSQLRNGEQP